MSTHKLLERRRLARQSRVRVISGLPLIAVLPCVALLARSTDLGWLAALAAVCCLFFSVATGLEYWNALRQERTMEPPPR